MRDEARQDLRARTRAFALAIVRLVSGLPRNPVADVIARQLMKSATSPGAQYREACRAKSDADFISKLEGCLQELDESVYWLEILHESGIGLSDTIHPLT